MVRREQARAAATAATERVNQEIKSVKDSGSRNWSALQAKITAAASLRGYPRETVELLWFAGDAEPAERAMSCATETSHPRIAAPVARLLAVGLWPFERWWLSPF